MEVSTIRSVRYSEVFNVQYLWEKQLVHSALSVIHGRCPLFGVSAKRGSTVYYNSQIKAVGGKIPLSHR